jgi:hypothetical protein
MPLNMRILESRDPDGRIVESIIKGEKVRSSDYSALCTHSKSILDPFQHSEGIVSSLHIMAALRPKSEQERQRDFEEIKASKIQEQERQTARHNALQERQTVLFDRAEKRRAKRLRRKNAAA